MIEILMVLAYLIGSIPTALIVSKAFFGVDIRDYGSGNMGATNTFRFLGKKFGTMVMISDVLKGVISVLLCNFLPFTSEWNQMNLMLIFGIVSVIGHILPIFAGFRGGKGVATLLGVILAIQPFVALSCIGVFLLVFFLTRYVSLSSILGGLTLPLCVLWIWNDPIVFYRIFAVLVSVLIIVTHQKNIIRLINGNESRVLIRYPKRHRK